MTLPQLRETVERAQSTLSAGYLEDVAGLELPVQQASRIITPEQLMRTPVPEHPSGVLRLEDVAEVKIDGAPRRGNAGYRGQQAVVLSVQKVPGANTMELTRAVDEAVREFSESHLPPT